jgi:hypothetical protein
MSSELIVLITHRPADTQVPELRNFYKHLHERGWSVSGYGDNADERDLLERFHYIVEVFLDLKPWCAIALALRSLFTLSDLIGEVYVRLRTATRRRSWT